MRLLTETLEYRADSEEEAKEIIERFLDLFTTAVPPSLPACLSIGIF